MLLAFAEKTLAGLVFSALIVGVATYFGQPFVFDPIILIAFFAIAIAFRRNLDLLSICAIFVAERGLEELMWRFMDYSIWFKIPSYLVFLAIPIFVTSGRLRTFSVAFIFIGIAIETFWYFTGYNAPKLLWNFYLFAIALLVRRALRMRVFWLVEFKPSFIPKPIFLDSQLLFANAAFIALHCLIIAEYWARHLTGINELLFVHPAFPYVSQGLSVFMLYMIVIQSVHHLKELELSA